jgi:hypothetical protein
MAKKDKKSQHGCVRWALREHLTTPCCDFACGGLEDCHHPNETTNVLLGQDGLAKVISIPDICLSVSLGGQVGRSPISWGFPLSTIDNRDHVWGPSSTKSEHWLIAHKDVSPLLSILCCHMKHKKFSKVFIHFNF